MSGITRIAERIATVSLTLTSAKNAKSGDPDTELGFKSFINSIYSKVKNKSDQEQYLYLIKEFFDFLESPQASELRIGSEKNTRREARDKFSEKITTHNAVALRSRAEFERLAFNIMSNNTIDTETKREVLNDLYDPLTYCAEGAEGELHSKNILLDASSVSERLRSFLKAIIENCSLSHTYEDGTFSIHTRNNYMWQAYNAGLTVLGQVAPDENSGGVDKYNSLPSIRQALDTQYTVDKFLESEVASIKANIKPKFSAGPKFLERILQQLAYLHVSQADLNLVFIANVPISFDKLNELITRLLTDDISCVLIEDSRNYETKDDKLYILHDPTTKILKFKIPGDNTFHVIAKSTDPLYKHLLQAKDDSIAVGAALVSYSGIKINEEFVRSRLMHELNTQDLLRSSIKYSNVSDYLKKKHSRSTGIELTFGDLTCKVYSLNKSVEIAFYENGKYLAANIATIKYKPYFDGFFKSLQLKNDTASLLMYLSHPNFAAFVEEFNVKENTHNIDEMLYPFYDEGRGKELSRDTQEFIRFMRCPAVVNIVAQESDSPIKSQFLKILAVLGERKRFPFDTHMIQDASMPGAQAYNNLIYEEILGKNYSDKNGIPLARAMKSAAFRDRIARTLQADQGSSFTAWFKQKDPKDVQHIIKAFAMADDEFKYKILSIPVCKVALIKKEEPLYTLISNMESHFQDLPKKINLLIKDNEITRDNQQKASQYNMSLLKSTLAFLSERTLTSDDRFVLNNMINTLKQNNNMLTEFIANKELLENFLMMLTDFIDLKSEFIASKACLLEISTNTTGWLATTYASIIPEANLDYLLKFIIPGDATNTNKHNYQIFQHIMALISSSIIITRNHNRIYKFIDFLLKDNSEWFAIFLRLSKEDPKYGATTYDVFKNSKFSQFFTLLKNYNPEALRQLLASQAFNAAIADEDEPNHFKQMYNDLGPEFSYYFLVPKTHLNELKWDNITEHNKLVTAHLLSENDDKLSAILDYVFKNHGFNALRLLFAQEQFKKIIIDYDVRRHPTLIHKFNLKFNLASAIEDIDIIWMIPTTGNETAAELRNILRLNDQFIDTIIHKINLDELSAFFEHEIKNNFVISLLNTPHSYYINFLVERCINEGNYKPILNLLKGSVTNFEQSSKLTMIERIVKDINIIPNSLVVIQEILLSNALEDPPMVNNSLAKRLVNAKIKQFSIIDLLYKDTELLTNGTIDNTKFNVNTQIVRAILTNPTNTSLLSLIDWLQDNKTMHEILVKNIDSKDKTSRGIINLYIDLLNQLPELRKSLTTANKTSYFGFLGKAGRAKQVAQVEAFINEYFRITKKDVGIVLPILELSPIAKNLAAEFRKPKA